MKQAILLHGTGGSGTDYFWFEDTKKFLEDNGYEVWWEELPNTNNPNLEETLKFVTSETPDLSEETIVICHSSACPLALHWLENQDKKVKQVILVSGYYEKIDEEANSMLPPSFDWASIKSKSDSYIFINSDNDPWKCTDDQARTPAKELGAPLIVNFGEGHMGSGSFNQPYREFKLLKRLIEV